MYAFNHLCIVFLLHVEFMGPISLLRAAEKSCLYLQSRIPFLLFSPKLTHQTLLSAPVSL